MKLRMSAADCREEYLIDTIYNLESEVQVNMKGSGEEFRVVLMNRTHSEPVVNIAYPGIGGNFKTSYRWQSYFNLTTKGLKKAIRDMLNQTSALGEYKDNGGPKEQIFVQAVSDATWTLIENNSRQLVSFFERAVEPK